MSGFILWEIDAMLRDAIAAANEKIDQETGEVPEDWAMFLDEVQMERDQKCLAVAAVIREMMAEADAIAQERKRLQQRERAAKNKSERLKQYLATAVMIGEKMRDTRVAIGWTTSHPVVITDEAKLPESCFKIVREVSKTAIKEMISSGQQIDGAHIEERKNITIR